LWYRCPASLTRHQLRPTDSAWETPPSHRQILEIGSCHQICCPQHREDAVWHPEVPCTALPPRRPPANVAEPL
jgi:hypothetical protein